MNNTYLKGPGDFEPDCKPEPTEQQVNAAIAQHAVQVCYNARDGYPALLSEALREYAMYRTTGKLDELLYASAEELLERGEI